MCLLLIWGYCCTPATTWYFMGRKPLSKCKENLDNQRFLNHYTHHPPLQSLWSILYSPTCSIVEDLLLVWKPCSGPWHYGWPYQEYRTTDGITLKTAGSTQVTSLVLGYTEGNYSTSVSPATDYTLSSTITSFTLETKKLSNSFQWQLTCHTWVETGKTLLD